MQVIEYRLARPGNIIAESVVWVTREGIKPKVNEKNQLVDLDNTLADPKMGPILGLRCATCGGNQKECPTGHFGAIDLGGYVIQNTFKSQLMRRLKCICTVCLKFIGGQRCIGGEKCKPFKSVDDREDGCLSINSHPWTAKQVYDFLNSVHPSVWLERNLPNPLYMIATHIYVLPNPDRIYTKKNGDITSHVFTVLYNQLLMVINKRKNRPHGLEDDYSSDLYLAYNNVYYATRKSWGGVKQMTGILKSLKSKEGVLRRNLLGKRVDYCARAVIRGDYRLRLDQIGVPQHMVSKLTVPVHVPGPERFVALSTIRKWVEDGHWSSIICQNGLKYDVHGPRSHRLIAAQLTKGDIVNRWLKNGDSTLFLRQPTLHKGSLMKFDVKIHEDPEDYTISLNMYSTTPYNADCDGDEMNLFIPQTEAGRSDINELMDIKSNILNENGHVQIYPIQNVMLALHILTSTPDLRVPRRFFYRPPRFGEAKDYSGFEFVSNPLPPSLNCKGVKDGLVCTVLTKSVMKSIIKELYFMGEELTTVFLHELGIQSNQWVCEYGVSMEIDDFVIKHPFDFEDTTNFGQKFSHAQAFLEKNANKNATMHKIISSGSKGSFIDYTNVSLVVGQQYVANRPPIPYMGDRMFPAQAKGDFTSNLARGIITHCYMSGLLPEEVALHAASAKDGVINKAVNIKSSGDRFRKLSQRLESLVCSYVNGMVMDTEQNIVQFKYGEDGLDPKFANLHIPTKGVSDPQYQEKLRQHCLEFVEEETVREKLNRIPVGSEEELNRVIHRYERSKVEAGHACGMNAAHCISEPATQAMLDSIHHSGSKSQTNNQRIRELFGGSNLKDRGVCTVIVDSTEGMETIELKNWRITKQKLKVTPWMQKFMRVFPYQQLRFTLVMIFFPGRSTRDILIEIGHLNVCASHHIFDGREVTVHVSSDERGELEAIVTKLKQRSEIIKEVSIKDKQTFTCVSSLKKVFMALPHLNHLRTTSTCLEDTLKTLGIEAARAMLLREFKGISNFSDGIDIRHLLLMVDSMTYTGEIIQMDYHGMKHLDSSVLGKASFEHALEELSTATALGIKQRTNNISECVLSGRLCPIGSGYNQFQLVDGDAPPQQYYDPVDELFGMIETEPQMPQRPTYDLPTYHPESPMDTDYLYRPASPLESQSCKRLRQEDQ